MNWMNFRRPAPALLAAAAALLLLAGPTHRAAAQVVIGGPPVDTPLDAATRKAVLAAVTETLTESYVFPEMAAKMNAALARRQSRGEYNKITSSIELADSLTSHLQQVSHDKHLRVVYREEPIPEGTSADQPTPEQLAEQRRWSQARNYGFEKLERLPGNIGYLELRAFEQPNEAASEVAVAAMNFLSNSDALIIDLRKNGGGSPEMIQLLTSYLYEAGERVHLNDLYWRQGDRTEQYWTLPHVPGRHSAGKDVYILTSRRTFSAAEEFSYNLKNLKRATLVGETTGGGAHPGGMARLGEHFEMFCPTGRAISPVTGTNWEGTGVVPDIAVAADQALRVAHVTALETLIKKAPNPGEAERLTLALDMVKAEAARAASGTPLPSDAEPGVRIVIKE